VCVPRSVCLVEISLVIFGLPVVTVHLVSYAEVKEIKSLTLHYHGCPWASFNCCWTWGHGFFLEIAAEPSVKNGFG